MDTLVGVALADNNQPRDIIAACKAILSADKMNMVAESIERDNAPGLAIDELLNEFRN